jgi:hypothetical protein
VHGAERRSPQGDDVMLNRYRFAAATAVLLLLLAGCQVRERSDPPPIDRLSNMLLSEQELDAILAPIKVTQTYTYRKLIDRRAGEFYSPPECMVVAANTMAEDFATSGFRDVRGAVLDPDTDTIVEIDQGVVRFDTPEAARAHLAATVQKWKGCAGVGLTINRKDRGPWQLTMGLPATEADVDMVDVVSDSPAGYVSTHAMRVVGDVLIDLRASHRDVNEHAAALVNAIANRNRL